VSQIALPLAAGRPGPSRIVVGNANSAVIESCAAAATWPFRTALLIGPPRSGKSLIARWFGVSGAGEAIDDADQMDETDLFHRWNRAQEKAIPQLLVSGNTAWQISLPDLASRVGAALQLVIADPDDAMLAELIAIHGEQRGLAFGLEATTYLAARCERTHLGAERLVAVIDRLSLERKAAPGLAIWRAALDELYGPREPRLI
jgi:hypothetical protein